jgi:hypothetical protein
LDCHSGKAPLLFYIVLIQTIKRSNGVCDVGNLVIVKIPSVNGMPEQYMVIASGSRAVRKNIRFVGFGKTPSVTIWSDMRILQKI